jgi:hypothetical protein
LGVEHLTLYRHASRRWLNRTAALAEWWCGMIS